MAPAGRHPHSLLQYYHYWDHPEAQQLLAWTVLAAAECLLLMARGSDHSNGANQLWSSIAQVQSSGHLETAAGCNSSGDSNLKNVLAACYVQGFNGCNM
jgi:hypothetical protein